MIKKQTILKFILMKTTNMKPQNIKINDPINQEAKNNTWSLVTTYISAMWLLTLMLAMAVN